MRASNGERHLETATQHTATGEEAVMIEHPLRDTSSWPPIHNAIQSRLRLDVKFQKVVHARRG